MSVPDSWEDREAGPRPETYLSPVEKPTVSTYRQPDRDVFLGERLPKPLRWWDAGQFLGAFPLYDSKPTSLMNHTP